MTLIGIAFEKIVFKPLKKTIQDSFRDSINLSVFFAEVWGVLSKAILAHYIKQKISLEGNCLVEVVPILIFMHSKYDFKPTTIRVSSSGFLFSIGQIIMNYF